MRFPHSKRPASPRAAVLGLAYLVLAVLGITALPGSAQAWWDSEWSFRKEITIDAGATGAAIQGDVSHVPVLIRLHDGDFKFSDAKPDGTDLRFVSADDKTPLNAHVEMFDTVFDLGLIWVDVPTIKAGAATKIWMYYGNPKAASASDPHAAYDTDQTLVYHFGEKGAPARDWTAYGNNALSGVAGDTGSLIGQGVKFDGGHVLVVPGSSSLAVASGGSFTWAAWIKPDRVDGNEVLYARHDGGLSLVIGLDHGTPYATVTQANGAPIKVDSSFPVTAGKWHHIAITADQQLIVYVDGQAHRTVPLLLPPLSFAATVGGDAAAVPGATGPVTNPYAGSLDELEISRVARSESYIHALYASQGPDANLVRYGQDEQNSGFSTGYIGVILKSVTIDGWVIIVILMFMAVFSWWVMYNRASYVGTVGRNNASFLKAYREADRDVLRFEQMMMGNYGTKPTPKEFRRIERAPLYKLLAVTVDELEARYGRRANGEIAPFSLSAPTLNAIRSSVEAALVHEIQRLNSMMVLLTIAISGGPFIGLLGTVVGVMITFAAIAASGDVNVNSIAPGIAAALLATCAGMFVAIPALFGYNYLTVRMKEESTIMRTFEEQFMTRLAELYHAGGVHAKAAAE